MAREKTLTLQSFLKRAMLVALFPALVAGLSACSGSDGSNGLNGKNGTNGTDGAPGTPAPVTNETCDVCHTTGKLADIALVHPDPTNKTLTVTITSVAADASGFPVVNFHVATGATPVTGLTGSNLSIKIADMVAAGTGDNTYSTDYYEMTDSETPGTAVQNVDCATDYKYSSAGGGTCVYTPGTSATLAHLATPQLTDLTGGDYTYTFAYAYGAAWPGYNNAGYNALNHKRIAIELSKPPTGYNKAVGILDIDGQPANSATANAIPSERQFVTIQACRKCHGPLMDGAAHADSRNDMRECVFCHSPLYGSLPRHAAGFMADDNADLPVFIHQIHASKYTKVAGLVGQPVTFPQDVKKCVICHSDPSGAAPGDLSALNNWKSHPTGRVCASCHTTNTLNTAVTPVTFTHDPAFASKGAPAGAKNDSQCSGCHAAIGDPADPADIVTAHDTTPVGNDVPEYDVTLSLTAPANGVFYKASETFTVTATLKDHATGLDVNPALYTTAQDAAYVAGGGLHIASLYVYGPRTKATPLLGTQGLSLFGKGDATGFHYDVAIPATVTNGTYMIRGRFADYSYDRNNPTGGGTHAYQIESIALNTIQIGTATEEQRVAGVACVDCHGTTTIHTNDHAAPFATDHCLSCHDQSGGHADPIYNRVHAIHSANSTGDFANYNASGALVSPLARDWSDVTYPQSPATCVECHTTSNKTYKTNASTMACGACHFGADAVTPFGNDHIIQNGGKL